MEINLEKLQGKQVFMMLRDVETLAATGLEHDENIFVVRGYEKRLGIWVEAEGIKNCPIKADDSKLENCRAVIFIPWHHIVSIVHFPGKENLKIDAPATRKIGFRQD